MDKKLIIDIAYLLSAVSFIYGLKMLSHPKTARNGNMIASLGMLIAIIATVFLGTNLDLQWIVVAMVIGIYYWCIFCTPCRNDSRCHSLLQSLMDLEVEHQL